MRRTNTHIICAILVIFITLSNGDQGKIEANCEDAKEILPGRVYYWRNWCFCRDTTDLYIWSEAVVLRLGMKTDNSGWFEFVIDGKLMLMYPSCSLANKTNSAEVDLQKVRRMIKSANDTQPILSYAKSTKLFAGNWFLISRKEGELTIQHDTDGQQVITLQEDFPGFTSESYGKKLTFSANTSMGAVFSASWITGRKTNQLRPKAEAPKPKVITLQEDIPGLTFESEGRKRTFLANSSMGAEFSTSWITGRKTNQIGPKAETPKPKTEHQSNLTSCSTLNRYNSGSGLTEIQCNTKAHFHNISYVWNIERFDLHRSANKEIVIRSPSFSSAAYDKIKWYLEIHPGNKNSDNISLFLHRCPNSTETRGWAKFSVSFLDCDGNLILNRTSDGLYTYGAESSAGWPDNPISKVVSSDNTLRIVCEIAICEFTTKSFYHNRTDTIKNPENNRSQDIVSSTKKSEISDVVLIFSKTGKEYPANKAKLAASSPVFAAMFNISYMEKGKDIDRVNITDVDSEQVFDEILRYIYTGKCENIENLTSGLLVAAQKYKLDGLKTDCLEKIRKNLTVQNSVDTLILADKHGISELKSKAIRFIAANYAQVSNTSDWKQIVKTNSEFVHEVCEMLSNYLGNKEIAEE